MAACLAAILEIAVDEVPVPEERHPEPWTVWRNWLAQRAVGLVPIAEPSAGGRWAGGLHGPIVAGRLCLRRAGRSRP